MDTARTIIVGDKIQRPVMDYYVTSYDVTKAREELNETPETKEATLKAFKEILASERDFNPRVDDVYLMRFLRVRKFNCQRAHKLVKDYYKIKGDYPALFPPPSAVEKALRANIFNILPHRDDKGRAIFIVKLGLWDTDEISYYDFLAVGNLVCEYVLDNPVTQINGFSAIYDFEGYTYKHFLQLCSPRNTWLLLSMIQDRFPGRTKSICLVNCLQLAISAWNFFKPFMKEKLRTRVKVLGSDMRDLHAYLDPSILPEEYGGVMPPSDNKELVQRILEKEQDIIYDRKFGYPSKDIHKRNKFGRQT